MVVVLTVICALGLLIGLVVWIRRMSARREIEQYSITPEDLRRLFDSNQEVLLFDVRLPLDLLARSEIIPGAKRLAPREVLENPALIPKDKDSVVYCTCPSDETSREVLHRVLGMEFLRTKFLRGGLEAWKASGFPVVPYEQAFQIYSADNSSL
jgi:rhodanese-related sulfurtransferase